MVPRDPFPPRTTRDRWEAKRRRQAEWARLDSQVKQAILEALHRAPQRPRLTQLELRVRQRRL